MQINRIILTFIIMASTKILEFAPKRKYFSDIRARNGVGKFEFPRGQAVNAGGVVMYPLKEVADLIKFSGSRDEVTCFISNADDCFENCVDYGWTPTEILRTIKGLFPANSSALDTWRAIMDANVGQVNTVHDARGVIQDFIADLFGETNLGDHAFDYLRRVQHCNLMSRNYEDQLMEFTVLYDHLRDYLRHMRYLETADGIPDIGDHSVKIVFITMLGAHQQDWLQANVRDAQGNLIRLYTDDGRTALQISEDLGPYYNTYCSGPGQRPPTKKLPRLLRGDGTTSGNGNGRKRNRDDDEESHEEINYKRRRFQGNTRVVRASRGRRSRVIL